MRFRLLGPLEVQVGEDWLGIGSPKWRSILAALLINAGQIVPADVLIREVWGHSPPAKAANLLSIYVLRLRRFIGDADGSVLVTRAPGYLLRLGPTDSDVQVFEAVMREGRRAYAAGDPEGAAAQLAEALALWRDGPLADVPPTTLVETEADRLAGLQLDAVELRIKAELTCDRHAQAIPELRRLLADHALRECLWVLLIQALDAAGRHAEALDAYSHARNVLAEELGVDPGVELRQLYADLLAKDDVSQGETVPVDPISAQPPYSSESWAFDSFPGQDRSGEWRRPGQKSQVPAPVPAQLPADVADFTGREDQVRRLCDLLTDGGTDADPGAVRIALVAGSGGLGKTSLAVRAAHRIGSAFPDGQLYVDLLGATPQPLPAADVLARFLRDLGVDGRDIPADEDQRAARYRAVLAGRRVLVVLDNARDAAQVRPLLPGTASCAALITTRSRMPDLASTRLVDLNMLDESDALTLFARIVGEERAAAEPEATAELLLACAGLPLAIRICAARLATRSGWTIQAMASRLSDQQRRLDELSVGDLAVRASFQVSFANLPVGAQAGGIPPADAFRLLGLWRGPSISSAAAAALFGTLEYLAEDALETLVDAHLLESTFPGRYKFHDLLRVYSSERAVADLSAPDREAAVGRLLGWYVHTADAAAAVVSPYRYNMPLEEVDGNQPPLAFATVDDALAWYDSERANLVAATRQASAEDLDEIAWRLPVPLFAIFDARDNWADLFATHHIALASARRAGNRLGEAWTLNNLGVALCNTGDSAGIAYLEQALAIRREIGDQVSETQAAATDAECLVRAAEAERDQARRQAEQHRQDAQDASQRAAAAEAKAEDTYAQAARAREYAAREIEHLRASTAAELGRIRAEAAHEREAIATNQAEQDWQEKTASRAGPGGRIVNDGFVEDSNGLAQELIVAMRRILDAYRTAGREQAPAPAEAPVQSWPGTSGHLPGPPGNSLQEDDGPTCRSPATVPPDTPGYDLRPDPLEARTAGDFVRALGELHAWAGFPSFREMEKRCNREAASATMCTALRSDKLPSLKVALAIVTACRGDEELKMAFATAWRMIQRHETATSPRRRARQPASRKLYPILDTA